MTQGEIVRGGVAALSTRKLSARARSGLDVARAVAAIYVVVHHAIPAAHAPRIVESAFSFGQEAVIVFFLLSGFVIFSNEAERSVNPRGYYLRRVRRLYPAIILAMLLSTGVWALGLIDNATPTLATAIGTLLSVQDISFLKPGVIVDPYLGNSPLWSLSYEVFFYAVFPLVMLGWRKSERLTRHGVGAIAVVGFMSYLIFPNHLSLVIAYFLLWWVGAMAARAYLLGDLRLHSVRPELFWTAVLTVVAIFAVAVEGSNGLGLFPVLMVRHFGLTLLLLALLTTPLRHVLGRMSQVVSKPAGVVASISYGLYIFHYPLLVQPGLQTTLWVIPLLAVLVALAWFSDRLLPQWLPRAPRN